jgi:hypothetical protein
MQIMRIRGWRKLYKEKVEWKRITEKEEKQRKTKENKD